jgi:SRSO17 transposase
MEQQPRALGCEVRPEKVVAMVDRLGKFLEPFRKHFGRSECGEHAAQYVNGRLMQMDRRTIEPIAKKYGVHRRGLQNFVGAGPWCDAPVRKTVHRRVRKLLGDPRAILVLDGSGFEKSGKHSVGTKRQWCGRLGKVENCQVGEFLAYAAPSGVTITDAELYLPREWATDPVRREAAHVPKGVVFRTGWQLALQMLRRGGRAPPHGWIVGDDQYGRVTAFRDALDGMGERYQLDVPASTTVRRRDGSVVRVEALAHGLSRKALEKVRTRNGQRGPIEVYAYRERVTPVRQGRNRRRERKETLLVTRDATDKFFYHLSNASGVTTRRLARVVASRHYAEEGLETAKSDAGLAEYEVRSWVGWHHHMTLTMVSMLFLVTEHLAQKRGLQRSRSRRSEKWLPLSWPSAS